MWHVKPWSPIFRNLMEKIITEQLEHVTITRLCPCWIQTQPVIDKDTYMIWNIIPHLVQKSKCKLKILRKIIFSKIPINKSMLNKVSAHEWLCVALKLYTSIQSVPGLNPKKDIRHTNKILQFSVLPHKCQDSTSNQATNTSFHIFSNSPIITTNKWQITNKEYVAVISGSVTTAWHALRLHMGERPPIWRADMNILNKQLWTATMGGLPVCRLTRC